MGISKWHNADFLAVTVVLAATAAAEMTVAAEEAAAVVVVVPAAALPDELSLHSQVLTCLHICNSTGIVNDKKKCTNFRQINVGTHMHIHS